MTDPLPVEALLINAGWVRSPVAGRHVGIWDLPGTDAMVQIWDEWVHVCHDTRQRATTYGIADVEAIRAHLDGIRPAAVKGGDCGR